MLKKTLAFLAVWLSCVGVAAAAYPLYVPVSDIAVQYLNGQMRFCPKANLKGIVCGQTQKLLGKQRFVPGNWWSPETYVEAVLAQNLQGGLTFQILGVEPGQSPDSLVIYFEVHD